MSAFLRTLGVLVLATATATTAACRCEEEPARAPETALFDWGAERHHIAGLTEGEPVGSDLEHTSTLTWMPQPPSGMLDPELSPLRLRVRHTVGTRRMSGASGAFTAAVPLAVTLSALDDGRWHIEPRCDDTISAPIPAALPDGSRPYPEGATFWLHCVLELRRAELSHSIQLEIYGDGRLEGRARSGAVTVTSAR